MVSKVVSKRSDMIGAVVSGLCLIHCLATPLLFLAKSCAITCCAHTPSWWKYFDYIFLLFSFGAVYLSAQNSSKKWMQVALWASWLFLLTIILNEQSPVLEIPEFIIYFPTLALVFLHIYNRKYCQCQEDTCCANEA